MSIFRFTPEMLTQEELQEISVGRDDDVAELLRKIDESARDGVPRHYLIVGQKGIGKTHLLLLIFYSIKKENLSDVVIPIKFAEEEYSILSVSDLILKCLELLDADLIDKEYITELRSLKREEITEHGLESLRKVGHQTRKMFVLMLENLDLLFEQLGEQDIAKLRQILQSEDLFIVIGTAPAVFKQVKDYKEPFYNFFEIKHLDELNVDETEILVKKALKFIGEDLGDRFNRPKIKAISILTGGNPRLILLLCQIVKVTRIYEVEDTILSLLDELTPIYKDRMESLPAQQRLILDALALSISPSTPTEIAKKRRLNVNTVTSQLKRLEQKGFVKRIRLSRKRAVRYEIADRLFRIWREMRRTPLGKQRIWVLARFLEIWYTPEELVSTFTRIGEEVDHAITLGEVDRARRLVRGLGYVQVALPLPDRLDAHSEFVTRLMTVGELEAAEREIREFKKEAEKQGRPGALLKAKLKEIRLLLMKDEPGTALKMLETVFHEHPTEATAWRYRGRAFGLMGNNSEALKSLNKANELDPNVAVSWRDRAIALLNLERLEETLESLDRALELDPNLRGTWCRRGSVLDRLERHEEALECYDKALEIEPSDSHIFAHRGFTLSILGRSEEALLNLEKALALDPDDDFSQYNQARVLNNLDRFEEALVSIKRAVELKPDVDDIWVTKGWILANLRRYEDALLSFNRALELERKKPFVWFSHGRCLLELERYDEALRSFQTAIELEPTAKSYLYQGIALNGLNKREEALESYDRAIRIEPNNAHAMYHRGDSQLRLGRYSEAIRTFTKVTELSPNSPEAWLNCGIGLRDAGDYVEARRSMERGFALGQSSPHFTAEDLERAKRHILEVTLLLSHEKALEDDETSAVKELQTALDESDAVSQESFQSLLIEYLRKLLSARKLKVTEKAVKTIIGRLGEDYSQFLVPISKALVYSKTKDPEILERLQQEMRETVEEVLKEIEAGKSS